MTAKNGKGNYHFGMMMMTLSPKAAQYCLRALAPLTVYGANILTVYVFIAR